MKRTTSALILTSISLMILGFATLNSNIELAENNRILREQNESLKQDIVNFQNTISNYEQIINDSEEKMQTERKEYEDALTNYYEANEENLEYENVIDFLNLQVEGLKFYIKISNGVDIKEVKKANFDITKYTDAMGAWSLDDPRLGTMANGEKTHIGAAAMPKSIPFGTQIAVMGNEESSPTTDIIYTTKDRGGAVVESSRNGKTIYRMDVWTNSHDDAISWAKRNFDGYIYFVEQDKEAQ